MQQDITNIRCWSGWLDLATLNGRYSKAVVGWSMAEQMRIDLICDAITMAAGQPLARWRGIPF